MGRFVKILTVVVLISTVYGQGGRRIFSGTAFGEGEKTQKTKSLWTAVGLSVLMPGAGERYLGVPSFGNYLTYADGMLLASAVYFAVGGAWREEEYKTFAQKYAGVDPKGKDDEFFRIIGLYSDRDTYNYIQKLYDREDAQLYPETPEWNWNWRSLDDQERYYDIRVSSEKFWRNFKIALGIAGINRLVSVINVVRLYRGGGALELNAQLFPSNDGENTGVKLTYNLKF